MSEFKRWDEFFDKKNNDIIKENVSIPVNPNQFTIKYEHPDEFEGVTLSPGGYFLEIKTPQGIFYTKLGKMGDDIDMENLDEEQ